MLAVGSASKEPEGNSRGEEKSCKEGRVVARTCQGVLHPGRLSVL